MGEMFAGAVILLLGFAGGFNFAVVLGARGRMEEGEDG